MSNGIHIHAGVAVKAAVLFYFHRHHYGNKYSMFNFESDFIGPMCPYFFMDGAENDPQCIRECVVHYFVLFAVYNGPGQHLTRMEAHQGGPIRT